MSKREEAEFRLQNVSGRDPSQYPFGFFSRDDWFGGAGSFYWYETEEQALFAIKNDLVGLLSNIPADSVENVVEETISHIQSLLDESPTPPAFSEELRKRLDGNLINICQRLDFVGNFIQLCIGENEFEKNLRQQFREDEQSDDYDDIDNLSPDVLQSAIEDVDLVDFASWVKDYCLF